MKTISFASLFQAFSLFACLAVPFVASVSCSQRDTYITVTGFAQGGTYSVKYNQKGDDGMINTAPEVVSASVDSILNVIDNTLSGYNKGSLLSRFNAGEDIIPNEMFRDIYSLSHEFYNITDGAVDVASGPLFDIWGFGFTSDSLPADNKVNEILSQSRMDRLKPTMEPRTDGHLCAADMLMENDGGILPRLNYNAVAQGYSCDIISQYLFSIGVKDMLVDIGGEIYCSGVNPAGTAWSIGVDKPEDGNNTPGADLKGILQAGPQRCGVVTSGNYRKFYVRDGKKYAHTIDPRTGYPVSHSLLSATIVAGNATLADALATFCMVVGFDSARDYIESQEGIEGYLIYDDEGQMKTWASTGFRLVK